VSGREHMRVLLVCHRYPPLGVAGVERLTQQAAEELARRGHEVTVLTRRATEAPSFSLERRTEAGVQIVSVAGGGHDFGRFPVHEPALERLFERMLAELSPDAVLATHLMHHSPGYVAAAHRWRVPFVLELHDFFMLCPRAHLQRKSGDLCDGPEGGAACAVHCFGDQRQAQLRWALRSGSFAEAVRTADAVPAPSRYVAERFAERRDGGWPIEVVPNGIADFGSPVREERDPAAPLHLASVGITVEHKGFRVAAEALRLAGIPARYTVFGIQMEPEARHLRETAALAPNLELELFGEFSPAQLPTLLAGVDAVVVPSIVPETFSIVAREAFACGIPVIASEIGALPEAIRPDDNGWLFPPGDAIGLATLLQELHADPARLRRTAAGIRPDDVTSIADRIDRVEALLRRAISDLAAGGARRHEPELGLMREALAAAGSQREGAPARPSKRRAPFG
jgi:glycosyltransferase involved in cell wall biosynthesis